jgi:hypothetical protein
MIMPPLLIEETNLSNAWCKTLGYILKRPGKEITPLLLTLTKFEESSKIRGVIDSNLKSNKRASVQTVAETIFPDSLYQFYKHDRHALYKGYINILPRIKKIDSKNGRGTYFERLIAFDGKTNQLEIIISSYLKDKGVRRSKLQASILDPREDHIDSLYQGFPCLQHLTFFATTRGGLILNSFYAIQYLYERAYGNWLGLINLGKFMANELHLNLERFNCYVGVEQLDHLTKTQAHNLLELAS